jgi:hypothetical protein
MQDLDRKMETWSSDRDHSFKIRGETFHGRIGLDYEIVIEYLDCLASIDSRFKSVWTTLVSSFLGTEEFTRFDAWRIRERDAGNPLTIYEVTLIGAAVTEEETSRPTRASSGSSTGRETNGDGSTGDSSSPDIATDRQASLSAVS